MRSKLAIALLIAALLCVGAWSGQGQTDKVRRVSYEYTVMGDPTAGYGMDEGIERLNQLGSKGWELAGVAQEKDGSRWLYFKRLKRVP